MNPLARPVLAAAMSRHAGVVRDQAGLERLRQALGQAPPAAGALDLATVEATSLHTVWSCSPWPLWPAPRAVAAIGGGMRRRLPQPNEAATQLSAWTGASR